MKNNKVHDETGAERSHDGLDEVSEVSEITGQPEVRQRRAARVEMTRFWRDLLRTRPDAVRFVDRRKITMPNNDALRLAVLIDADNASAAVAKELLEEVAKYGTPTIKRAYGDWTTPNLGGWKDHLHKYAIQPMQQFAYTKGKNSTDSAFIIDAMDLLYAGNVDGFCLVSSDSDFTRLATRLREAGKVVYGLGERKTPEPFIAACDKFIFLEVLKRPAEAAPPVQVQDVPDLKDLMTHAIKETLRDNGWTPLSAVGAFMSKNNASFDPRNYGFTKLGELVRKQPYVEVKEVKDDASGFVHLHVRMKA